MRYKLNDELITYLFVFHKISIDWLGFLMFNEVLICLGFNILMDDEARIEGSLIVVSRIGIGFCALNILNLVLAIFSLFLVIMQMISLRCGLFASVDRIPTLFLILFYLCFDNILLADHTKSLVSRNYSQRNRYKVVAD